MMMIIIIIIRIIINLELSFIRGETNQSLFVLIFNKFH